MTAVDRMLDALREEVREAREEKESAAAYQNVLGEVFSAIAGHHDPKLVEIRLQAQSDAVHLALQIIRKARESK